MNNVMPYFNPFMSFGQPNINQNNNQVDLTHLENKIERLEKNMRILENRLNNLENNHSSTKEFYQEEKTDMYML